MYNMTDEKLMDSRQRLLESARALFHEKGYEATSPRDILKSSGVGQGSMYHHFGGKKDLALTVLRAVEEEKTAKAKAILETDAPPLQRVAAYLKLERDALKGCPLGRHTSESVIQDEALREPVTHHFTFIETALARALKEAQEAGELSGSLNAEALSRMLFATLQGGYVLARAHGDAAFLSQALDGALSLLDMARTGQEDSRASKND